MTPGKYTKFLKELTTISKKHKFIISGCGCCGSPYFDDLKEDGYYVCDDDVDDGDYIGSNIIWMEKKDATHTEG